MLSISFQDFLKMPDLRLFNMSDDIIGRRHIKGISIDSRTVGPEEVFWALRGERFDGHDFVNEAFARGALFCVIEESASAELMHSGIPLVLVQDTLKSLQNLAQIQRLKYSIPVIGLTGSNGKTTVKQMLSHLLQKKGNVHKTHGNLNNHIGCPLTMLQMNETHEMAILEMGTNSPGEIAFLGALGKPTHALVTLIGEAHLEKLKTREGIAKEKLSLFDQLPANGTVYQNMDDPFIADYNRPGLRYVRYAFENDAADVKAGYGDLDDNGCGALILDGKNEIRLQVAGLHNVRNALAAAAVALDFGLTTNEIAERLSTFKAYEKRMQIVAWRGAQILNDAYNASPSSMRLALDTVQAIRVKGKKLIALGDMFELGEDAPQMHGDVLKYAAGLKEGRFFLIGDMMHEAARQTGLDKDKRFILCRDLNEMAGLINGTLQENDLLMIKGSRGMQMEKILAYIN